MCSGRTTRKLCTTRAVTMLQGGVYEGEWANGTMNGLGVRTFSTGQVKVRTGGSRWLAVGSERHELSGVARMRSRLDCGG